MKNHSIKEFIRKNSLSISIDECYGAGFIVVQAYYNIIMWKDMHEYCETIIGDYTWFGASFVFNDIFDAFKFIKIFGNKSLRESMCMWIKNNNMSDNPDNWSNDEKILYSLRWSCQKYA
jgi:hypothetical protein